MQGIKGVEGQTFEINIKVRVFDEDALELAFEDLENAEIIPKGDDPNSYTVEQKIAMLIKNVDLLADYREIQSVCFIDMGFEEVQ